MEDFQRLLLNYKNTIYYFYPAEYAFMFPSSQQAAQSESHDNPNTKVADNQSNL